MPQVLKLRQRRSQARRKKIVARATSLFAERGVDATTLTDVARKVGMPLPSLYDYFRDKRSLIAAVPEQNFVELYEALDERLADVSSAVERLSVSYLMTFEYITRHADWARVFYLDIWPSSLAAEEPVRRSVDTYGRRFVSLVEAAISEGAFRKDLDPRLAMTMMMGTMCQLTAIWLLYDRPFSLVTKGEEALSLLCNSFSQKPCRNKAVHRRAITRRIGK